MFKKELTEEQIMAKEAKKAERAERRAELKQHVQNGIDAAIEIAVPMVAGVVIPFAALIGICWVAGNSAQKKQDAKDDILAQGYGFTGHDDPGFVKMQYEDGKEIAKNYFTAKGGFEDTNS